MLLALSILAAAFGPSPKPRGFVDFQATIVPSVSLVIDNGTAWATYAHVIDREPVRAWARGHELAVLDGPPTMLAGGP